MKRILIFGSRHWQDQGPIDDAITQHVTLDDVVVHGACPTGADRIAELLCERRGISVERHHADWGKFGRVAGPIRNELMAESGLDLALGFGDGRGTRDMRRRCEGHGVPVVMVNP